MYITFSSGIIDLVFCWVLQVLNIDLKEDSAEGDAKEIEVQYMIPVKNYKTKGIVAFGTCDVCLCLFVVLFVLFFFPVHYVMFNNSFLTIICYREAWKQTTEGGA